MESVSKGKNITGWVITILIALFFFMGAAMSFLHPPSVVAQDAQMGYDASKLPIIGALMLLCAIFYLIPRTAVFGAVLITAWLGGAVATHIRAGEDAMALRPIVFAGFVWLGIYLREPRVGHILPVRK